MEAPEPEPELAEPGLELSPLHSFADESELHVWDSFTRKVNAADHYRLGVALGRHGVIRDALTRIGSKPHKTLGAVMSVASKFRNSLKEDYTVDLNEEEEGDEIGVILRHPSVYGSLRGAGMYDGRSYPLVKEMLDSGGGTRPGGYEGMAGVTVTRGRVKDASTGHHVRRPQFQILFNDYERGRSKKGRGQPV